ncbi:possible NADPH-quinone reductase [Weissella oryzae SG25]|uniref:Possible NADPH-quinone reductase n=1 Tax=Weissella oryzae (strain DSM 25784 / JCM 18191 / LMG 30913 / SG25) TaxID=1329250 RepID=A0A069CQV9_WEIOS|nr:NADP-dependent oxidoreductase [Weissella oryzae]GAK30095.1 possible NADPH-quinone reductase [Weissella oryzae SG25]
MQAVELKKFGSVDVLESVEKVQPILNSKQVLIANQAVAIDPYDVKFVAGQMGEADKLPLVPGSTVVGKILAVGSAVSAFKVGDRVAATRHHQTYAQEVAVGQSALALVPNELSDEIAAAASLGGAMGYQAIKYDLAVQAGEKILIQGGAGAVGSVAVQMALLAGATVFATASPKDFAYLKSLGPVTPIDYQSDYEQNLSDFDGVLDTVGGAFLVKAAKVLRPGGKLRTLQNFEANLLATYELDATSIFLKGKGKELAELLALLAQQTVKIRIGTVRPFTLGNLRWAHQAMRDHQAPGKIVLTFA